MVSKYWMNCIVLSFMEDECTSTTFIYRPQISHFIEQVCIFPVIKANSSTYK